MHAPPPDLDASDLAPMALLRRVAVGVVVLFALLIGLGVLLKDPVLGMSVAFVDRFGPGGVFMGVVFTDAAPLGLTHEPILLAGYAGGLSFGTVFAVGAGASVFAGVLGWLCGGLLGRVPTIRRWFKRYRVDAFMTRYGVWAVAVAALTPFPFSIATWSAGIAGLGFGPLLLGCLFRVPKVLFYFGLIVFGWDVVPGLFGG